MAIYRLKEDNFDSMIKHAPQPCIVLFSSAGCHLCTELKPIFKNISNEYEGEFYFFLVDIDESESLRERYSDDGVPTIRTYRPEEHKIGHEIPYPGDGTSGYTKQSLVDYINNFKRTGE